MTPHHETARKILDGIIEDAMTRKSFPQFWEDQCSEFARGQIEDAWAKIIAEAVPSPGECG